MKTFVCVLAILMMTCALLAAKEESRPHVTVTLTDGKSGDYKLDWIDEEKVVVIDPETRKFVRFRRKEVAWISLGEDKSGRFRTGQEGFVLNNGSLVLGHPTSMDIDTYWIVPQGSRKEEKVARDKVVFIQMEKPSSETTGGRILGLSTGLTLVTASPWVDTGVDVVEGQKIWFTVSGMEMFSCGPDAPRINADGKDPFVRDPRRPLPDVKQCALIAKIGTEGAPFRVGLNTTPITADAKGRLYIEVNDFDFRDNQGKLSVYIKTGDL